jgi:hypothetical protein
MRFSAAIACSARYSWVKPKNGVEHHNNQNDERVCVFSQRHRYKRRHDENNDHYASQLFPYTKASFSFCNAKDHHG